MRNSFFTFLILILSSHHLVISRAKAMTCLLSKEYRVIITSGLPDNTHKLSFRCQSKDNDLGNHTLSVAQSFSWKFCGNFMATTRFFCHFYWETKNIAFDVFELKDIGQKCVKTGNCYWLVISDGFFFSIYELDPYFSPEWLKRHDWPA